MADTDNIHADRGELALEPPIDLTASETRAIRAAIKTGDYALANRIADAARDRQRTRADAAPANKPAPVKPDPSRQRGGIRSEAERLAAEKIRDQYSKSWKSTDQNPGDEK